ncbi:MAG TPA: RluA family pseudouridine synthase [Candidatus Binatia bacterium]|jgi:23S rRNA pseudouridine1911/1915/1917 synthase|nr:RluA family pseudouridine synthase [Candidatus Binatia bacterium]
MDVATRLAALHPGASRTTLKQWLSGGRVRLNGEIVRRGDVPVTPDDRVTLGQPPPPPLPGALRIVLETPRLVVVDKPPGLLSIATDRERHRTAYRILGDHLATRYTGRAPRHTIFVVHRLDRETSGLLVFAKTQDAKRALQAQFVARTVERVYVAVVEGRVQDDAGTLRMRLGDDGGTRVRIALGGDGREAVTHYRVLTRGADTTRLEVRLETGRRGQIRAQLAAMGHVIVGDAAYRSRRDPIHRLCLHSTRLAFDDDGEPVVVECPMPAGFLRV